MSLDYYKMWQDSEKTITRLREEATNNKGYSYKYLSEQADELIIMQIERIERLSAIEVAAKEVVNEAEAQCDCAAGIMDDENKCICWTVSPLTEALKQQP